MNNSSFRKKAAEISQKIGLNVRKFINETHVLAESAGIGAVSGMMTYAMASVAQSLIDNTGTVKLVDSVAMTSLGVGASMGLGTFAALVLTKAGIELKDRMTASSQADAAKQLRGATRLTPEQVVKRNAMAAPLVKTNDPAAAYNKAMDNASVDGYITEQRIRDFKSVPAANNVEKVSGMQVLQASGVLGQGDYENLSPRAVYDNEQAWSAWAAGEQVALAGIQQGIPDRFADNALHLSFYTRGISDGVDQLKFAIHDLNRELNDSYSPTIDGIPKDRYPFEENEAKLEAKIDTATGLLRDAQAHATQLQAKEHAKTDQSSGLNAVESFLNSSGFAAATNNQNMQVGAQAKNQSAPKLG
jgi:hypothetical protein